MAHTPPGPPAPGPENDPAGNTQMFRAFVDEGGVPRQRQQAAARSGSMAGVVAGVVAVIVVLAAVVWFALG